LPKSELACRSAIRKRDAKPELAVRRFLHAAAAPFSCASNPGSRIFLEITFLRSSELDV
jgi:hypothetical protein